MSFGLRKAKRVNDLFFVIGEFCSNRSLAVWSSHTERVAIGKTSQ